MMIDCFTCLDELKGRDRSDARKILAVLDRLGRFSTFDVDSRMAATMTWLCNSSGWIKTRHSETAKDESGLAYERDLFPWIYVTLTDAGRAELMSPAVQTPIENNGAGQ